jgi:membrane-associated protein
LELIAQPIRPLIALGPSWLDSHTLIETFGLLGVLAIVFVESGLLVGFFLPGDSLLFTAGLLSSNDVLPPLWVLLVTIPVAAILGDQVGYAIGRKAGPPVFSRPNSRFFKWEYVERAEHFFERYGGRTIIIARFVPIVRTIAPVMAGVGSMRYRTFLTYNIIGGIAWGVGLTTLGYFLGQIQFIEKNLEPIILLIVFLSVLPIGVELWRARRREPAPDPSVVEATAEAAREAIAEHDRADADGADRLSAGPRR